MTRFDRLMLAISLAMLAAMAILMPAVHLTLRLTQIRPPVIAVILLLGMSRYAVWRGFPRIRDVSIVCTWAVVLTNLLTVLVQIAARSHAPLADATLARLDSVMGISTLQLMHWCEAVPHLSTILAICYSLLTLLMAAALLVPPLSGERLPAERFVLSIVVAALLTFAIFIFLPAVGPWTMQGFPPLREQAEAEAQLRLLKSSPSVGLNLSNYAIVAFPSFHAILAILAAAALWGRKYLRIPAAILAVAVCISTVTTGWHYIVDVMGGIAVAAIAWVVAARVLREEPFTAEDAEVAEEKRNQVSQVGEVSEVSKSSSDG
jgi:membrane-associated phospholipid phosphatase